MIKMSDETNQSTKQDKKCRCKKRDCYECNYYETKKFSPQLATDCVVVNSLICSKKIHKIAELSIPIPTLGDIISIGPGGIISPLVTLTPDLNGIVTQVTVVDDMVINTGFLPANITVLGLPLPIQINLPFQQETVCAGVCPEDTINESPYKIEAVVTQGIEALGVSVANILFKVVLSTNLTVTRPVVTKSSNLKVVKDVNGDRCEKDDCYG